MWEYMIAHTGHSLEEIENTLNSWAVGGWEHYLTVPNQDHGYYLYFRRRKENAR